MKIHWVCTEKTNVLPMSETTKTHFWESTILEQWHHPWSSSWCSSQMMGRAVKTRLDTSPILALVPLSIRLDRWKLKSKMEMCRSVEGSYLQMYSIEMMDVLWEIIIDVPWSSSHMASWLKSASDVKDISIHLLVPQICSHGTHTTVARMTSSNYIYSHKFCCMPAVPELHKDTS